jgi:hypothetical protein
MSAVPFASVSQNRELGEPHLGQAVRSSSKHCYQAKFQTITYLKDRASMLNTPAAKTPAKSVLLARRRRESCSRTHCVFASAVKMPLKYERSFGKWR